jgi:hypothetical protein
VTTDQYRHLEERWRVTDHQSHTITEGVYCGILGAIEDHTLAAGEAELVFARRTAEDYLIAKLSQFKGVLQDYEGHPESSPVHHTQHEDARLLARWA